MNSDFLRRLYWACSSGATMAAGNGCDLSALYELTHGAHEASERFSDALREAKLDRETVDVIEELSGDEVAAYEEQGFINGFRLGMKLAGELRGEAEG